MVKAIVLGAGKGTRLSSEETQVPKVLRRANGKPLIEYVLQALDFIEKPDITIVVGFLPEQVKAQLGCEYAYVLQESQLGTGHAVAVTEPSLANFEGHLLICYGDMPLLSKKTLLEMVKHQLDKEADCTLLVGDSKTPLPYGRIIRGSDGRFVEVIEEKDCNPLQKALTELNMGVYVVRAPLVFDALKKLTSDNAASEFYLTDLPGILAHDGYRVETHRLENLIESQGVNTEADLVLCEGLLRSVSLS